MRASSVVSRAVRDDDRGMQFRIAFFCLALALILPSAALGALSGEQAQGSALATKLASGSKTCADLSNADLEHIGEYAMGRALGSTALHQAMNDRMQLMLGDKGETRMHQLMGSRFAGCGSASAYGAMGPGMMGAYSGGAAGMMSSGDWRWMRGDTWRHMSQADWRSVENQLAGTSMMSGGHHGWGSWWIVVLAVAGVVLAAVAVALLVRRACAPPGARS